jgi:hypothetical protein
VEPNRIIEEGCRGQEETASFVFDREMLNGFHQRGCKATPFGQNRNTSDIALPELA